MSIELEKAQIMWKLARKKNWNNKYDRLEHFKRFPNLKTAIKELEKQGFIITRKKPNFVSISLNSSSKKEIALYIRKHLPWLKE